MLATAADIRSAIRNGSTLDSATVDNLLAAADAAAKSYLRRTLESGTYTERVKAASVGVDMFVGEWPVSSVTRTVVAGTHAMDVWNSLHIRATVLVTSTGITLRHFNAGTWTTQTLLFATYPTLSQLQAAIALLSGWDATLSTEVTGAEPSAELCELSGPIGVAQSNAKQLYLLDEMPLTEWDSAEGTFCFLQCGVREGESVLVEYTGGYSPVPADVSKAVGMIAAEMYAQDKASVSAGMRREKLGDYEGERFQDNSATVLTPTVMKLLNPYRRLLA